MTSKIEVKELTTLSGETELTLGESGKTIAVPSGTTLDIKSGATIANNGTATGFASDLPCFYVEMSGGNQSVSTGVVTKVNLLNTSNKIDTHSVLDSNGMFTATASTAGIWQFNAQLSGGYIGASMYLKVVAAILYKNGAGIGEGTDSLKDVGGPFGLKTQTQTISIMLEVASGDTVALYGQVEYATSGSVEIQQRGTNFSGQRVSS